MAAVVGTEMINYAPETVAETAATEGVGGAITATEVTMGSLNELFYTVEAEALGGGSVLQHAKCFHKNTNASAQTNNYGLYIANAIDNLATAQQMQFVSTSASDDSSKMMRVQGFNGSGTPIQDEVPMNGTTPVTTSLAFVGKVRCELRENDAGAALVAAAGFITISHNSLEVGEMPPLAKTANNEADIGFEASLGGTTTIALPSTPPSLVVFSRPRTEGSRLIVNSGAGTLTAGQAQAFWWRWTVAETMLPSGECQFFVRGRGSAAAPD